MDAQGGEVVNLSTSDASLSRAVSTTFSTTLVIRILAFASQVVILRYIGPSQYGFYTLAYLLTSIGNQLADGGLSFGLVRGDSEPTDADRESLGAANLLISTVLAIPVAGILVAVARRTPSFGADGFILIGIFVMILITSAVESGPSLVLNRRRDFGAWKVIRLGSSIAFYAVAVPMVVAGWGMSGLAVAQLVSFVVRASLLIGRAGVPVRIRLHARRFVGQFRVGAWFFVETIAGVMRGAAVQVVLASIGLQALAFYTIAMRLLEPATFVTAVVERVLFLWLRGVPDVRDRERVVLRVEHIVIVTSCLAAAPIVASGSRLSELLFGNSWAGVGIFIVPVALAVAVLGPESAVIASWLHVEKGAKWTSWSSAVALAVIIVVVVSTRAYQLPAVVVVWALVGAGMIKFAMLLSRMGSRLRWSCGRHVGAAGVILVATPTLVGRVFGMYGAGFATLAEAALSGVGVAVVGLMLLAPDAIRGVTSEVRGKLREVLGRRR